MPDFSAEQAAHGAEVLLADLSPVVAVFEWEGCEGQIDISGPLEHKMGADEGVIFQLNDNRRGIAENLGMEAWKIEGMAAVFGRLMLSSPELVQIAPIVYAASPANRHTITTDYRDGVVAEIDGERVASGAVRVAELKHIKWLEAASRATEKRYVHTHPSQSFTMDGMSGRAK